MAQRLYQRVDNGPLEPGEFRVEVDGMNERRVFVACPRCGAVDELHRAIGRGGLVGRWPCSNEACSYVDFLQLEEILR